MSILLIGKSSFLVQSVKAHSNFINAAVLGSQEALEPINWPQNVSVVINFAADPAIREGSFSDLDHRYAAIASERQAKYIMLSSRAVYGISDDYIEFKEDQTPLPLITPYGQAKRQIETDLLEHFNNIIILRLSNVFGFEYTPQRSRRTFMGVALASLKEKGGITFSMSPETKRDFLPVEIFADWLSIITSTPNEGIYNIGSSLGIPCGDIAHALIEGYSSGELTIEKNTIQDSFALDMKKTTKTFDIQPHEKQDIDQACINIGRKLKE